MDILSSSERDEYKYLSLNKQSLNDAEHKRFRELLGKMGYGGKGRRNLSEKHSTARRRRLSKTRKARKARNTRRRY
jgi:hypothetical protein